MQRSSKNSRMGPQSFAGSFVSDRSEGQKSLASIASMMSDKVLHQTAACLLSPWFRLPHIAKHDFGYITLQ